MIDLVEPEQLMRVARGVGDAGGRHHRPPAAVIMSRRSLILARSMRSTSSAGISYSSWSRQANTTKVANAPMNPAITIHQICQISANPMKVAKNAQTNPVGELRGISIGRYSVSLFSASDLLACAFIDQSASSPRTSGSTAKLNTGGGDEVAPS